MREEQAQCVHCGEREVSRCECTQDCGCGEIAGCVRCERCGVDTHPLACCGCGASPRLLPVASLLADALSRVREGWTQGVSARDENGDEVYPFDMEAARCWCLTGAIAAASEDAWNSPNAESAYEALVSVMDPAQYEAAVAVAGGNMPCALTVCSAWNDADGRTVAEVSALIGRAIRAVRS